MRCLHVVVLVVAAALALCVGVLCVCVCRVGDWVNGHGTGSGISHFRMLHGAAQPALQLSFSCGAICVFVSKAL